MKKLQRALFTAVIMCLMIGTVSSFNISAAATLGIKIGAEATGELSGITASYDFNMRSYYSGSVEAVNYADSKGSWEYHSRSHDNVGLVFTMINPIYGISVGTRINQWVAFKIRIPTAGKYSAVLTHARDSTGGISQAYLMDINSNISLEIENETPIGTIDYYAPSLTAGIETSLSDIEVESAGEYLLVFRAVELGPVGTFNFLSEFTLNGGESCVPIYAVATSDKSIINVTSQTHEQKIDIGETCNVLVSGYLSDGSSTDYSGIDIGYESSDISIATVDEFGVVTGEGTGIASITVTITVGNTSLSTSFDIEVGNKGFTDCAINYNFTLSDDVKLKGYADTMGAWKYEAANPTTLGLLYKSYGILTSTKAAGQWVAYRLRVPVAGTYTPVLKYSQYVSGGTAKVFILDGETDNLSLSIIDAISLGTVNFYGEALTQNQEANLNDVSFDKAGEYIIVLYAYEKGPASFIMYPSAFKLIGGENVVDMGAYSILSNNNLQVGETATVSTYVSTHLSDGITESTYTLSNNVYSSTNESVVQVDLNGSITAVGAGTANVVLTSSYSGTAYETYTEVFPITVAHLASPITTSFLAKITDASGQAISGEVNCEGLPGFATGTPNSVTVGTQLTVIAPEIDNKVFLYWKNENSKRVVSNEKSYTLDVGTETNIAAVYNEPPEAGQYLVEFIDGNKKVLKSTYVTGGTQISAIKPADPYSIGYQFKGWSVGDSVSITSDTIVRAQYNLNSSITADISVVNGTLDNGLTNGVYNYNEVITVQANSAPDGYVFAYWKRDGKAINYNNSYTFRAWGDTQVEAVYSKDPPIKVPQVLMDTDVKGAALDRAIFMMERMVPEGYTLIESGILLSDTSTALTLDNYQLKATAQLNTPIGQFTVRFDSVGSTVKYARAYVIYKVNNEYKVVYSDIVSN